MLWRKRPLIGVTGPSRSSIPAWFFIRLQIWIAGGRAIHIRPGCPLPKRELAGLVLGGGADIDPALYREKLIPTIKRESLHVKHRNRHFFVSIFVWMIRKIFSLDFTTQLEDRQRDELEFGILRQVIDKKVPILGICRGAQLLNVYFGGTLYQDIADFYNEKPQLQTILPISTIIIEPQSQLYSILRKKYTRVNSLHHQSVKTLGSNLRIVAQEPSGVVEAIEHTQLPFVIGVQWHPEFLITYRRQRQLFQALVQQARRTEPVRLISVSENQVSA